MTEMKPRKPFLTAEWRDLVMLNFEIDPVILAPLVPAGVELDTWQDRHFVSIVGFLFRDTRVRGLPIPFHVNFEEVNLRFYVRRHVGGETRRAVVFIKEVVPRWAIAQAARLLYNEPYVALPMDHKIVNGQGRTITYRFRQRMWNTIMARVEGQPAIPAADSEASFIIEHYWGYTAQRDGGTLEYRVEHPPWRVWLARDAFFTCGVEELYGPAFAAALARPPDSAFVAEGSPVAVYPGARL
jgi:uncharacterized protein YqjF (DUF2071 family)